MSAKDNEKNILISPLVVAVSLVFMTITGTLAVAAITRSNDVIRNQVAIVRSIDQDKNGDVTLWLDDSDSISCEHSSQPCVTARLNDTIVYTSYYNQRGIISRMVVERVIHNDVGK